MAGLRPHLALVVTDVQRAIPFYEALFGVEPERVEPGYATFSVAAPALGVTLTQGERTELGAFNHAGIQVSDAATVLAARERLVAAGVAAFDELDITCCHARQDKIWVRDPDGIPWEVFATHQDTVEPGDGGLMMAEVQPCGCGSGQSATACCSDVKGCCAA